MKKIGVLSLSNNGAYIGEHPDFGSSVADGGRYGAATICKGVRGAWAHNVVPGDPTCEAGYVEAAQDLVQDGVGCIISDCGFSVRYQQAIAAAVPVPVSTSSLLLLPALLRNIPENQSVGVITADSRHLDAAIIENLGVANPSRLVIEGLEGTETYDYMWAEDGRIHVDKVISEIDDIVSRFSTKHIGAILCECTILVRVSPRIRRLTRLPVFDAAMNAALLVAAVG